MTEVFFVGDTVEFFVSTNFDDLTSATTKEILVTKPSGEAVVWTATQVDPSEYTDEEYDDLDLTNQDLTYTTKSTDLDEIGAYKIQSHIIWNTDSELHGAITSFKVKAHLAEVITP
jgi:hypothetical protein